jgi:hypothetical protein
VVLHRDELVSTTSQPASQPAALVSKCALHRRCRCHCRAFRFRLLTARFLTARIIVSLLLRANAI